MNDLSVLAARGNRVEGWPNITRSKVFSRALTRASESYFSYRKGADVLRGVQTSAEDAQQPIGVDLSAVGLPVEFRFAFDSTNLLRSRMAVLVGKNGSGKTFSLSKIAAGLAGANERVTFDARPQVNQVLAFVHQSSESMFKLKSRAKRSAKVRTFILGPGRRRSLRAVDDSTHLLLDIARGNDEDGPLLKYLLEFLGSELPGVQLLVPIFDDTTADDVGSSKYLDLARWKRGTEQRILDSISMVDHSRSIDFVGADGGRYWLSAGQLSFLRFTLQVLANVGPASVVLIDEPENFLHPNLISRFLRMLHRLLVATRSISIIATHSPFVVREVQSANVHVLCRNETGVEVRKPRLQTLGANVGNVSDDVFGDDLPAHLFEDLIRAADLASLSLDELLERFGTELSPDELIRLARNQSGDTADA